VPALRVRIFQPLGAIRVALFFGAAMAASEQGAISIAAFERLQADF